MPSSAGFHSRESMSGPTRLNFADGAIVGAVTDQHDQQRVVGRQLGLSEASVRVTFSRVAESARLRRSPTAR